MKHIAAIALVGALVANSVHGDDVTESQQIVVAHELRTSFYERAPRSLAGAMSKAVDCGHGLVCESHDASTYKYLGIDLVADETAYGSCVPAELRKGVRVADRERHR